MWFENLFMHEIKACIHEKKFLCESSLTFKIVFSFFFQYKLNEFTYGGRLKNEQIDWVGIELDSSQNSRELKEKSRKNLLH